MAKKIFVFGSNTEGRHGKGAALVAKTKYGAIQGQARGLQGNSYAIVTKDLSKGMRSISIAEIYQQVYEFNHFARLHPEYEFIVSPIGCNLAGYTAEEMAKPFEFCQYLINVQLPEEFLKVLGDKGPIIAITGHRPNKLGCEYDYDGPNSKRIFWGLVEFIKTYKPKLTISGMALGIDQLWVMASIYCEVPFIATIPFKGQELAWPEDSRKMYYDLLNDEYCQQIVYVCDSGYAIHKMQKRNEWMVNHCDILLSIFDGTDGGTKNCCIFADKIGKYRININPKDV